VAQLDLTTIGNLAFQQADFTRFPCLKLAYDALTEGNTAPALLNAANEVAVEAFLAGRIGFRMIDRLIGQVMERLPATPVDGIEALLEQDGRARALTQSYIDGLHD
jgi:1-deoxy-D-xylulose-5-phosphate reductoisomerase